MSLEVENSVGFSFSFSLIYMCIYIYDYINQHDTTMMSEESGLHDDELQEACFIETQLVVLIEVDEWFRADEVFEHHLLPHSM